MSTPGKLTLEGTCHCGAVSWTFNGVLETATACNCTVCRRYAGLWAYDYEDGGVIAVRGPTRTYRRGKAIDFHFCGTCACITYWRGLRIDEQGRRRIAVNLRMTELEPIAHLIIDHFDGLDKFEDLPHDGRRVCDLWY